MALFFFVIAYGSGDDQCAGGEEKSYQGDHRPPLSSLRCCSCQDGGDSSGGSDAIGYFKTRLWDRLCGDTGGISQYGHFGYEPIGH